MIKTSNERINVLYETACYATIYRLEWIDYFIQTHSVDLLTKLVKLYIYIYI